MTRDRRSTVIADSSEAAPRGRDPAMTRQPRRSRLEGIIGRLTALDPATVRLVSTLAMAVAAGEVLVDWFTRLQVNVSIVYSLPLVLAAIARNRRLLWSLLFVLLCMTFAVYAVQVELKFSPGAFFENRLLASATMLLTATLLHFWMRALDVLEERDRNLKEQNDRLHTAYRELTGYQEQISRQNKELERRRKGAEAASAQKTVMLASMSHDIRTPLNAISLAAQAIEHIAGDSMSAARIPALAQRLRGNALSVANLVSDILDFSTLELGRIELRQSEFSLGEFIRQQCQVLRPVAQVKALTLIAEPVVSPVRIYTDRLKFERVLANLVMNAIKYTDAGFVRVSGGRTGEGGAWLRVHDSGIGIAAEDLTRIFDEFAQLQRPGGSSGPGWGLGLSICRRLLTLMMGTLDIESSSSTGSVFIVKLPPSCVVDTLGGPAADSELSSVPGQ